MPQYNNHAGRILFVFERVKGKQAVAMPEFASAIGVEDSWPVVFQAIIDLRAEFDLLTSDIEDIRENDPEKHVLFASNVNEIAASMKSFICNIKDNKVHSAISEVGVTALRFMAAGFPQYDEPADEIAQLRDLVSRLQSEVEECTAFSRSLKSWLLDLVRMIRDSLDRFKIRGTRGMRRQISLLVGELAMNWELCEEVQKKQASIWQSIISGLDTMRRVEQVSEYAYVGLEYAQKLPFLQALLPAPQEVAGKL